MADHDLSSNNWVWVPDENELFVRAIITDYLSDGMLRVSVRNGVQDVTREVPQSSVESCNPAKFNKCEDMAELTHLNEPSVIYNLFLRYNDDLIYTYSGLFLVAINPYKKLPIYEPQTLRKFHTATADEDARLPPHIFAIAENTHRNLVANKKDQSILVTGESGAGKTENTKKIIQYLSQISTGADSSSDSEDIHNKILRANPLLESFGNAKTIKNNNSSRFGKFIKIFFDHSGDICGATIDYYLLEKSRVSHQSKQERNYHVFYQLLSGAPEELLKKLSLSNEFSAFKYLSASSGSIANVDDAKEYRQLVESFKVMGFDVSEVEEIMLGIAVILHLGNVDFTSWKSDQASFSKGSNISTIASLLGVSSDELSRNLLNPKVKAGREYVNRSQSAAAVKSTIDAFAKHLYEKMFQFIINRINSSLMGDNDSNDNFIGVLDIAGFEIFDINSFEQLCINYTNEKLQQYFNHHSFILEQSEYLREDIQWEYIDFGLDLQPTIDLIETKQPMGVMEILNEQCILPKASEETFMNKLLETWGNGESKQFKPNKVRKGFIIDHYAGPVEYNIEDWLDKNKDPVSENILQLVEKSSNKFIKNLFAEDPSLTATKPNGKSPKLKTVTQRHKEQLSNLMEQLSKTEPHFVRCILPNLNKKANKFDKELILNQLRCNGVLEGIRIARAGYPNKMTFEEFFMRYSILDTAEVFTKNMKTNSEMILKHIKLEPESFKIGITKLFFKNGILGHLEELRDIEIRKNITGFQSISRGQLARTKIAKQIAVIQASQVIARNFQKLDDMVSGGNSPWLKLFVSLKPMLEDSVKVLDTNEMNESLKKLNGKLKETETAKDALQSENASLKDRLMALEDDMMKANSSVEDKLKTLEKLQKQEDSKSEKMAESLRQLSEVKIVSDGLAKEKAVLSSKLSEVEAKLAKAETQIAKLTEELEAEREKVKELELLAADLEKLKSEKEKSDKALNDATKDMDNLKSASSELESAKSQLHSHETKIKDLSTTLEEKERELTKLSSALAEKEKELEQSTSLMESAKSKHVEELSSLNSSVTDHKQRLSDREAKVSDLELEVSKLKDDLASKEAEKKFLSAEVDSLKQEVLAVSKSRSDEMSQELERVKSQLERSNEKIESLQKEIESKKADYMDENRSHRETRMELEAVNQKLAANQDVEAKLLEEIKKSSDLLVQLEESKRTISGNLESHRAALADFDKMKHEVHFLMRTKAENLDMIASLREQVQTLEGKLQDKENMPPPSPKVDPNLVNEYAAIKAKLNEQSAVIRTERFENQKLSEEVAMLRKKVNDNFESPSKRSEARRSVTPGDDMRSSQIAESKYTEEIKSLKIRLQQEESNANRAENYAIELQKKLNKLQATRGIDSQSNYETRFKESEKRVSELEKQLMNVASASSQVSDGSPKSMSRSVSFGFMSAQGGNDLSKIYNDMNHTLKATRDELNKSKSEILRLKALLRDSEDELYEIKKNNMKTSVRDYEDQLARLKVDSETSSQKQAELQQQLSKYKARSEEYYEKLELAESAVQISKRHEMQSKKELEDKTTELKLIREEVRATEKIIKQLRHERYEVDIKLKDSINGENKLRDQVKTMSEKIQYLNDTYGEKKRTIEEHKEEIRMLRDDIKFKLEKETEIIKENKRLTIDNDELLRIKEDVLAENKEVNNENEALVERNEKLRTEVSDLEEKKQICERKLQQNSKQIESLKGIIEENGRQLEALNATNRQLEQKKEELEKTVSELQDSLNSANRNLKILSDHVENLEADKKQTRAELDDLRGRWDSSDGRFKEARTENLVIVQENESLKTVNAELKQKVGVLEAKLYSNEQLKYLEDNVSKLTGDIDQLKHQILEGDVREEKLRKEVATLQYENESKAVQLKKYNDENFNYQNMVGQYRGKMEFLYQETSEKDMKIKAQERELSQLREKVLLMEKERLQG